MYSSTFQSLSFYECPNWNTNLKWTLLMKVMSNYGIPEKLRCLTCIWQPIFQEFTVWIGVFMTKISWSHRLKIVSSNFSTFKVGLRKNAQIILISKNFFYRSLFLSRFFDFTDLLFNEPFFQVFYSHRCILCLFQRFSIKMPNCLPFITII